MKHIIAWFFGLFSRKTKAEKPPKPTPEEGVQRGEPKWLTLARAQIGVKEVQGEGDDPRVVAFYKDAGFPEIKDDETPWCAAFCGAMLERSKTPSAKTLSARDYMTWGKALEKPYVGCIAVFSRGDPRGWQGHVGFYLGEDATTVTLLGGNQSDAVTIAKYPKSRLLGYRTPVTAANSRTLKAATAGAVSSAVATISASSEPLMSMSGEFKALASFAPKMALIGGILAIICFAVTVWARHSDLQEKGR